MTLLNLPHSIPVPEPPPTCVPHTTHKVCTFPGSRTAPLWGSTPDCCKHTASQIRPLCVLGLCAAATAKETLMRDPSCTATAHATSSTPTGQSQQMPQQKPVRVVCVCVCAPRCARNGCRRTGQNAAHATHIGRMNHNTTSDTRRPT